MVTEAEVITGGEVEATMMEREATEAGVEATGTKTVATEVEGEAITTIEEVGEKMVAGTEAPSISTLTL